MDKENKILSTEQREEIIGILKARFEKNMDRHKGIEWEEVKRKISAGDEKLKALFEMEATGGEPDVVFYDNDTDEYIFVDCSPESPKGRRSICYDREALEGRKENKPNNSAIDMANEIGIEILTEEQYKVIINYAQ